jgi:hypothetical protein
VSVTAATVTNTASVNRPGGDVEVRVTQDGSVTRLRGTWRRVGLRALWALPRLVLEASPLAILAWWLPGARPVLLAAAGVLLAVHLRRGWQEVRGVSRGWLEVDQHGIRGPALGADLPWSEVRELRWAGAEERPAIHYLTDATTARLDPRDLPTERLVDTLVPPGVPMALGDPAADPRQVRVEEVGFHVLPARGRPRSVRWDALLAVETTTVAVGTGRVARSLDLLAELRLPGGGRPREELLSLPITLAQEAGVLDALRHLDPTLPDRIAVAPEGTCALWSRDRP